MVSLFKNRLVGQKSLPISFLYFWSVTLYTLVRALLLSYKPNTWFFEAVLLLAHADFELTFFLNHPPTVRNAYLQYHVLFKVVI